VNFGFDDQQLEFRSQLRAALERECTPGDLRKAFEAAASGAAPARDRWRQLAEMGVVGITVPEAFGGLGLGLVDLVGLLEEAGRAGLPEPLAETSALVVPLLVGVASDSSGPEAAITLAEDLLGRIVRGELMATVVTDPLLPGTWVDGCDLVLIAQAGRVLAAYASDLHTTAVGCLDATRRLGTVGEPSGESAWSFLASGHAADQISDLVRRSASVSTAAVLLGVADRLIDLACDHARNRNQFGRPVGSFQAVKHLLADAYVALEMARPVVYAACCELDAAQPAHARVRSELERSCSTAKAVASEAAIKAASVALQVHGAIGYTWEHDVHLWMKRAWVLAAQWGDARFHYARVLETLTRR
jgi:alkylation response protein AidB-like acyl-CoA dehydrogenase